MNHKEHSNKNSFRKIFIYLAPFIVLSLLILAYFYYARIFLFLFAAFALSHIFIFRKITYYPASGINEDGSDHNSYDINYYKIKTKSNKSFDELKEDYPFDWAEIANSFKNEHSTFPIFLGRRFERGPFIPEIQKMYKGYNDFKVDTYRFMFKKIIIPKINFKNFIYIDHLHFSAFFYLSLLFVSLFYHFDGLDAYIFQNYYSLFNYFSFINLQDAGPLNYDVDTIVLGIGPLVILLETFILFYLVPFLFTKFTYILFYQSPLSNLSFNKWFKKIRNGDLDHYISNNYFNEIITNDNKVLYGNVILNQLNDAQKNAIAAILVKADFVRFNLIPIKVYFMIFALFITIKLNFLMLSAFDQFIFLMTVIFVTFSRYYVCIHKDYLKYLEDKPINKDQFIRQRIWKQTNEEIKFTERNAYKKFKETHEYLKLSIENIKCITEWKFKKNSKMIYMD